MGSLIYALQIIGSRGKCSVWAMKACVSAWFIKYHTIPLLSDETAQLTFAVFAKTFSNWHLKVRSFYGVSFSRRAPSFYWLSIKCSPQLVFQSEHVQNLWYSLHERDYFGQQYLIYSSMVFHMNSIRLFFYWLWSFLIIPVQWFGAYVQGQSKIFCYMFCLKCAAVPRSVTGHAWIKIPCHIWAHILRFQF